MRNNNVNNVVIRKKRNIAESKVKIENDFELSKRTIIYPNKDKLIL